MGVCCCKSKAQEEAEAYERGSVSSPEPTDLGQQIIKVVDSKLVDQLVLEMLALIASFVDNAEQSPLLIRIHNMAEIEEGWFQLVMSMVSIVPVEDPFGPSAITIMLDDAPLPSRDYVIEMTQRLGLCSERACRKGHMNLRQNRNICIFLACIAEKLAGPNSVAFLTEDTLDYLFTFLMDGTEACLVLFALIVLEKFALTTENKLTIKARFDAAEEHPLLTLERKVDHPDFTWKQIGFCAKWLLDNIFVIEDRPLCYEVVDMSGINAILNPHDVSEYLKISCDGLEARCDSYSFESVRCTFEVDSGVWYYEVTVMTPGVMQIGWATKYSHFLNHEGFGVGDDISSISYDGCRRLVWYKANPTPITEVPKWTPGDVLGCLLDLNTSEVIFSINGARFSTSTDFFETTSNGYSAAASFMSFQHSRFNFGSEPFKYPPTDRDFMAFNDHGTLTDEEKKVLPRRLNMERLMATNAREDSCTICYDSSACCVLGPCGHSGFCSVCTSLLRECPLCRGPIRSVRNSYT